MNGGNCIFCIFCVFIGIWLIFVDIFTQSNTKLSLKGFFRSAEFTFKVGVLPGVSDWCFVTPRLGLGGRDVGQFCN